MKQQTVLHQPVIWEGLEIRVETHHAYLDEEQEDAIADMARALAAAKTKLGPKPRDKKSQLNTIRSIATRQTVESVLHGFGRFLFMTRLGDLFSVPRGACQLYLLARAESGLSDSTLKKDKRFLQLIYGEQLCAIAAKPRSRRAPREVSYEQLCAIVAAQTPRNALSSRIAYAAGLRAVELVTIARLEDQPPSQREWHPHLHAGLTSWVAFTVKGKGGLVRIVLLPPELAAELEQRRRPRPTQVQDRDRNLLSFYDIAGGDAWASSFRNAAKRVFGESPGGHGVRHGYIASRRRTLSQLGFSEQVINEVLSQEAGHFRPEIISEFYNRGPWKPIGAGPRVH